ncbi:redoxin [Hyaloraphidium curvatum]|nr:redoxin [Hyaloraphidium curvatum]
MVSETVPNVTFRHVVRDKNAGENVCKQLSGGKASELDYDKFFKGKKVVLVSIPGPYTSTCSNVHLPGFIDKLDEIKALGADTIAFYSVADHWVMAAWGAEFGVDDKIVFLGDGSGNFAKQTGLTLDLSAVGMGLRSPRFAMVVDDGKVTYLGIESKPGVSVSGADAVIEFLKGGK